MRHDEPEVPMERFRDRREAGAALAARLGHLAGEPGLVVLGLPRGGIPVAYEVARALDAPLDVLVVRKLGVPGHEELALGAIASGGSVVLNDRLVAALGVTESELAEVLRAEEEELRRRERAYRDGRPPPPVEGGTVVLVDDGLATGATMRAAVAAVRPRGPRRVVVAVPVGAPSTCAAFERIADEVVCARAPRAFQAVGDWYRDFSPTSDDEVRDLLALAAGPGGAP